MTDQDITHTGSAVYKRLWGYTRRYWLMFVVGIVGVSIDAAMQAAFVKFMEPLIDRVFVGKDAEFGVTLAGIIFLIALVRVIGNFAGVYGMDWTGRKVVADLRQDLFDRYVALPASFYDRFSAGQLISKLAYNSEQVAQAASTAIVAAFRDVMLVIMLVGVMLSNSVMLTLVMLIMVPMIALLLSVISKRFRKISHRIQDSMGDVSHVTEEAVLGQKVVKVFQGQASERERFSHVNDKTRRLHMRMVATHLASSSMLQITAGNSDRAVAGHCHAPEPAFRNFSRHFHFHFLGHGGHDTATQTPDRGAITIAKRHRGRRQYFPGTGYPGRERQRNL